MLPDRMPHRTPTVLALALTLAAAPLAAQSGAPRESSAPLLTRRDAVTAGLFALGTAAAFPADRYLASRSQNPRTQENRFLSRSATGFRWLAEPGAVIIGAGLYAVGRLGGNERMATLGVRGGEAVALGVASTFAIKTLAGRARPYVDVDKPHDFQLARGLTHEEYRSFPSGHTTTAFAAAAVVTSLATEWMPDSRWAVGPAMYGGATMVGLSRMYNNKHWASDVMGGAAIGTFAGLKVVRYHRTHPRAKIDRWLLSASVTPSADGGRALAFGLMPVGR